MPVKVSTLNYFIKEGFVNLWRNRIMTSASLVSITASLFAIGIIVLVVMNTNHIIDNIESKIEITIFLKDDLTRHEITKLGEDLRTLEGVNHVDFVSKEQALERTREWLEGSSKLLSGYDEHNNPFPVSYIVRVDKPEYVDNIIAAVEKRPQIEKIRFGEDIINTLINVARITRYTGLALVVVLTLISTIIISNTIKLAVLRREKEINIMKYVGATDWFIKWPLILEGLVIGLVGAGIGIAVVGFGYSFIMERLGTSFFIINLLALEEVIYIVSYGFLIIGVTIGIMGTAVSIRKYLRV